MKQATRREEDRRDVAQLDFLTVVAWSVIIFGSALWGCRDSPREAQPMEPATSHQKVSVDVSPPMAPEPSNALEGLLQINPGMLIERHLGGKDIHTFRLTLEANEYIGLEIKQIGVDLAITILNPDGQTLLNIDGNEAGDVEQVALITRVAGDHLIKLSGWPAAKPGSSFKMQVVARRVPNNEDRKRSTTALILSDANRSYSNGKASARTHPQQARKYFLQSLQSFRRLKDASKAAFALYHMGRVETRIGEHDRAVQHLEASLSLMDKHGSLSDRATLRNDLANLYLDQGRISSAAKLYSEAIDLWQHLGDFRHHATTRTNLGVLYISRGAMREAIGEYHAALSLLDQENSPKQLAITLTRLGDALLQTEGPASALASYRSALSIRQKIGNSRGEAVTRNSIGLALVEANEPQAALEAFNRALEIFSHSSDQGREAVVRNNLGRAFERLEKKAQAQEQFRTALDLAQEASHEHAEAEALFGLARIERESGRLRTAKGFIQQALRVVETIRGQAARPELRSSFLAIKQPYYDFMIELLADLNRREPDGNHWSLAFEVSERARARSFLETLAEARATIVQKGDSADSMKSLTKPKIPTLEVVRSDLLDAETLLLEFHLGERESFLWAVTTEKSTFVDGLPGRKEIESKALKFFEQLQRSHYENGRIPARRTAAELSRMLFNPVASLLAKQRLLIVASGALEYVPFAALPDPIALGNQPAYSEVPPLALDHEIIRIPSMAVLGVLRDHLTAWRPPEAQIAILADPVFESAQPLPYTRRETEAILALANDTAYVAFGHEANRELVTSGKLSKYGILHFATHALLDTENPELSAILLSQLDASGRSIDGYLRGYEIFGLDLAADLVVLSACRTALGSLVRGEGFVSLARGFMHTKARHVVVSLWDVNDPATAELMSHFYQGLLRKKYSPAQALREAQTALWRNPRWRAPYYWAGFVLLGDWR